MAQKKQVTVQETLQQRAKVHVDFVAISEVSQALCDVMHASPNWDELPAEMKESLEMQAHKQARILAGSPNHADSWHDIAGYAVLVEQTL